MFKLDAEGLESVYSKAFNKALEVGGTFKEKMLARLKEGKDFYMLGQASGILLTLGLLIYYIREGLRVKLSDEFTRVYPNMGKKDLPIR